MSNLDSTQLERLKQIGAHLQQARQEQSKTLEEVAAVTYIPLRLLRAIESGKEDVLPEPVFIQGFIRRYGDLLGLDGTGLSKQFPINSSAVAVQTAPGHFSNSSSTRIPSSASKPSTPLKRQQPSYITPIVVGVVVLGGLIFGTQRYFSQRQNLSLSRTQVAPTSSPVAQSSAIAPSSPVPSPTPSLTPVPSPQASPSPTSPSPINVNLRLVGKSWVQIKVDGQTEFEGILQQGEQRNLAAKENLTIVAGNAAGVELTINDGAPQLMGTLGAVERITITPDNPQPSPAL